MTDIKIPDVPEDGGVATGAPLALLTDASIGKVVTIGDQTFLIHPAEQQTEHAPVGFVAAEIVDTLNPRLPSTVNQSVLVVDRHSLIDYAKLFKTPATRLFAIPGTMPNTNGAYTVQAVLDYHGVDATGLHAGVPDRKRHGVTWPLILSEQFKRWSEFGGQWRGQREAVEFLEENLVDISEPAGADILDVVTKFQQLKKVDFSSAVNLTNGMMEINYKEAEDGGAAGKITMPSEIEITIPIFYNAPRFDPDGPAGATIPEIVYPITVKLRRNTTDGQLKFQFVLHRIAFKVDLAFRDQVSDIETALGIKAIFGRPLA